MGYNMVNDAGYEQKAAAYFVPDDNDSDDAALYQTSESGLIYPATLKPYADLIDETAGFVASNATPADFGFDNFKKMMTYAKGMNNVYPLIRLIGLQRRVGTTSSVVKEFVNDTIQFIATGERDVCIESWFALLLATDAKAFESRGIFPAKSVNRLSVPSKEVYSHPIAMWLSHKGGLRDMMATLYIILH